MRGIYTNGRVRAQKSASDGGRTRRDFRDAEPALAVLEPAPKSPHNVSVPGESLLSLSTRTASGSSRGVDAPSPASRRAASALACPTRFCTHMPHYHHPRRAHCLHATSGRTPAIRLTRTPLFYHMVAPRLDLSSLPLPSQRAFRTLHLPSSQAWPADGLQASLMNV